MDILTETKHLQNRLDDLRNSQMSIGLVPTMGYLHDGHLSLIRKARSENDAVVTTIFVNPLQFAETEDLDTYPTDIEKDTFLASEAGTDLLFTPTNEDYFKVATTDDSYRAYAIGWFDTRNPSPAASNGDFTSAASIPEFSTLLMPIVSVMLIVGNRIKNKKNNQH